MSSRGSRRVITAALVGNVLVTATKLVAAQDPATFIVLAEDTGAILGILIALVGTVTAVVMRLWRRLQAAPASA